MNAEIVEKSLKLAALWQSKAGEKKTEFEDTFHVKMQKLLNNPVDKVFLIALMDQSFRSRDVYRVKDQIEYLFTKYGMATFFSDTERFLIFLFRNAGTYIPQISIPLFVQNIREDTNQVVLPGEDKALNKHLKLRKSKNVRVNVNLIGEVVLGEAEAQERMEKYLKALENQNIDYLSVKISTLYSQINSLDHEKTVEELSKRLKRLFLHAKKHQFLNSQGELENKFINLDMEEYKDLSLTVGAFKKALNDPELLDYKAGIVLQAYLPDSHHWQKKLTEWARERVQAGGSPIKVRLVKGANMEMEETEASLRCWKVAPYTQKVDTDSNYKIMAEYALQPENMGCVHLGLASHNIFELAYGYTLAEAHGVLNHFSIEMLEGMSEAARKAITEISDQQVILYAPTAGKEQFTNAIAYLVRRLDENTNEENFMRYSFGLTVESEEWNKLKKQFLDSINNKQSVFLGQKRTQNRQDEIYDHGESSCFATGSFRSEPDTDFVLESNRNWAEKVKERWRGQGPLSDHMIPVVVGGEELTEERSQIQRFDKCNSQENVLVGSYCQATEGDLVRAVQVAQKDPDNWRGLTSKERQKILSQVAVEVRKSRGDLIGVAAAEMGKVFFETDVEVSEAVDFLEYYGHATRLFRNYRNLSFEGKGVGLVVPPWNFPVAIPCGGVAAALAAGNTVILKPASDSVLCAYELAKCFWRAGVSQNVLQFTPCRGSVAGEHLVKNKDVDFVILTGGESTAYKMLEGRPDLLLTAETGGKDATIVTAMADREQAIANVVRSAFMNSGQKCSATSLLILENELFFDQKFKDALVDAAKSLPVGSVWDFQSQISTLVDEPSGPLKKAIESLDSGESWVLKPEFADGNKYMLKPSIKWGVQEGSYSHLTEFFGPVLSVMRADNIEHAVKIVNDTGYGLTSGIESLDEREVNYWRENIKCGNLYINRGTTGAIVLRQPFGGLGKSAIGAGRKVGVHNYITQFMNFKELRDPYTPETQSHPYVSLINKWLESGKLENFAEDLRSLQVALQSYVYQYNEEFFPEHDFFKLRGEDNIFRYRALNKVLVRLEKGDTLFDGLSRIFAAKVCGVGVSVSLSPELSSDIIEFLFAYGDKFLASEEMIKKQEEKVFRNEIHLFDRLFYSGRQLISEDVYKEANHSGVFIVRSPALKEGRLELLNYFYEQSISHSYHRYGNLGDRILKK